MENNEVTEKIVKKSGFKKYAVPILTGILVAFVLKALIHPITIMGSSMSPTLKDGQLYTTDIFFEPSDVTYNTIVCFKPTTDIVQYIKRIVAVPGDTVEIRNGKLYVNGKKQSVSFPDMKDGGLIQDTPLTLGDDEYFCLGDNRNGSNDSRFIGPVKYKQIRSIVKHKIF